MEEIKSNLSKEGLLSQRKFLEDLLKRRYFYSIAFDIYGGFAGLYDFGPSGCAIKNNVEQLWREHFILEEDMLEINSTSLVPEIVLQNSGHVEKFADFMVKDLKTGQCFRADKLIEEHIDKLLQKDQKEKKLTEEQKLNLQKIQSDAGDYDKLQLQEAIKTLNIKNPETGNDLSEPLDFNLMFKTNIGPTGTQQGYLRPETAQGIFVNFSKLLDFNQQKMPFAAAIVGTGYRNEIAPRSGLIRAREFPMAEIEHFVDPLNKSHSKFITVQDLEIPLFSKEVQKQGGQAQKLTLKQALDQNIIQNETLGYFLGRTYQFLVSVGVNASNIRFRQHREKEMAHYAKDCWDAEIEVSYGWVECVGIADRSAFDLERHTKGSKTNLVAARKFKEPTLVKFINLIITKQGKSTLGQLYKKESQLLFCHLDNLSNEEKEQLKQYFESNAEKLFQIEGKQFVLKKEYIAFESKEQNVMEEKYIPNVIEPSFGIGRILYAIFEHSFRMRDQKRTYLHLPPRVAPVKCSILTVISLPEFQPYILQLKKDLIKAGISSKVDDGGQTIGFLLLKFENLKGRRYARTDEIGIPFGITIDNKTLSEQTVTLREQETTKQVRISISEVVQTLARLIDGSFLWSDALKQYPIFEAQVEQNE